MYVGIVDEASTRELRRAVLRPNLTPADPLPGDDLPDGVHLAAVDDDGTVVSTCFIYPDAAPWLANRTAWHLRQMATRPERRGEGHGAAVLESAVRYLAAQEVDVLWCNARESAAGFYAQHGFVVQGAVFTDEQHPLPHLRMWRELRASPTSSR